MRKLLLTFVACMVAIAANAWSVKFTNPNNWSKVCVYVFGDNASGPAASWPGAEMTKGADGLWTYNYDGTAPANIIFNMGSNSGQTSDLTFGPANDGKTYNMYGPVDAALNEYSVYFDNSTAKWANVYAYCWDGVSTAGWPGDKVTTTDARGYYVFTYKAATPPSANAKIIWNNGDKIQTANLSFVPGTVYDQNGPVDAPEETYTVYFNNTAGWPNVFVYTFNPELAGSWPGTKLTANSDGSYQWDYVSKVKPECEGIIFSDGAGNQTDDLVYTIGATYNNGNSASQEIWVNLNGEFYTEADDNGVRPNEDGIASWTNQAIGSYPVYVKVWDGADKFYYSATPVELDTWTALTSATEGTPTYIKGQTSDCVYDVEYNIVNNEIKFTLVSGGTSEPTYPENVYFLGNIEGSENWAVPGVQMVNEGDGFYTLEGVKLAGMNNANSFFAFTTSDSEDWKEINANRYGPATKTTVEDVDLNKEIELPFVKTTEETDWNIAPGEYNITFDWDEEMVIVEKVADYEAPVTETVIYLLGEVNKWGEEEDLTGYAFTNNNDGTYTLSLSELNGQFKVATTNWSTVNLGGDANGEDVMYVDAVIGENNLYNNSSVNLNAKNWTNVTLTLTYTIGEEKAILNVQATVPEPETYPKNFYYRYTDNWDKGVAMPFVKTEPNFDGEEQAVYQVKVDEMPVGFEFKITADETEWDVYYGPEVNSGDYSEPTTLEAIKGADGNFTTSVAFKDVTLTFYYNPEGQSWLQLEGTVVEEPETNTVTFTLEGEDAYQHVKVETGVIDDSEESGVKYTDYELTANTFEFSYEEMAIVRFTPEEGYTVTISTDDAAEEGGDSFMISNDLEQDGFAEVALFGANDIEFTVAVAEVEEPGEAPVYSGYAEGVATQDEKEYPYTLEYTITYNADGTLSATGDWTWTDGAPVGAVRLGVQNPGTDPFSYNEETGIYTSSTTYEEGEEIDIYFYVEFANGRAEVLVPYTVGAEGSSSEQPVAPAPYIVTEDEIVKVYWTTDPTLAISDQARDLYDASLAVIIQFNADGERINNKNITLEVADDNNFDGELSLITNETPNYLRINMGMLDDLDPEAVSYQLWIQPDFILINGEPNETIELPFVLSGEEPGEELPEAVYVQGEWNGYDGEDTFLVPTEEGSSVYTANIEIPAGEFRFNLAYNNTTWVPVIVGDINEDETPVVEVESDVVYEYVNLMVARNEAFWTNENWQGGSVIITVDVENQTLKATFEAAEELPEVIYVQGEWNDYDGQFSYLTPIEEGSSIFGGNVIIPEGEFKFNINYNDQTWFPVYFNVASDVEVESEEVYDFANMAMSRAETDNYYWTKEGWLGGQVYLTVDVENHTLTAVLDEDVPSVIESIDVMVWNDGESEVIGKLTNLDEDTPSVYSAVIEIPAGEFNINLSYDNATWIPEQGIDVEVSGNDVFNGEYKNNRLNAINPEAVWTYTEWPGGPVEITVNIAAQTITLDFTVESEETLPETINVLGAWNNFTATEGDVLNNLDEATPAEYTGVFEVPAGEFEFYLNANGVNFVPALGEGTITLGESYSGYFVNENARANTVPSWTCEGWTGGQVTVWINYEEGTIEVVQNPYPVTINDDFEIGMINDVINIEWENADQVVIATGATGAYLQYGEEQIPLSNRRYNSEAGVYEGEISTDFSTTISVNLEGLDLEDGDYTLVIPQGYFNIEWANWSEVGINPAINYEFTYGAGSIPEPAYSVTFAINAPEAADLTVLELRGDDEFDITDGIDEDGVLTIYYDQRDLDAGLDILFGVSEDYNIDIVAMNRAIVEGYDYLIQEGVTSSGYKTVAVSIRAGINENNGEEEGDESGEGGVVADFGVTVTLNNTLIFDSPVRMSFTEGQETPETADVVVSLNTDAPFDYAGFQFDLTVPSFAKVKDVKVNEAFNINALNGLECNEIKSDEAAETTTYRVMARFVDQVSYNLTADLATVTLEVAYAEGIEGEYPVVIENTAIFSSPKGGEIPMEGFEGQLIIEVEQLIPATEVEITDVNLMAPSFSPENFWNTTAKITVEEALEFTVKLTPEESNDVLSWEADVDGVTVVYNDATGKYEVYTDGVDVAEDRYVAVQLTATTIKGDVSLEYTMDVWGQKLGDSNFSNLVSVGDVVTTANYIACGSNTAYNVDMLNQWVERFDYPNGNVVMDEVINTDDVTATVEIVMNPNGKKNVRRMANVVENGDRLVTDNFTVALNRPFSIGVNLDNTVAYAALQAVVEIPAGMTFKGMTKGAAAQNHNMIYRVMPNGNVNVVLFSQSNAAFGNEGSLFNLEVTATEECGDVTIRRIHASDAASNGYNLGYDGGLNESATTGIYDLTTEDSNVRYFTVDGLEIRNPEAGQIVIRMEGGKAEKVLVK